MGVFKLGHVEAVTIKAQLGKAEEPGLGYWTGRARDGNDSRTDFS